MSKTLTSDTAEAISHKRGVIYTAIFGQKDALHDPTVLPLGFDFVCFTDQDFTSKIWDVRHVAPPESDPILSARKYKILAHEFLPEYEYSVWVDGNVLVRGDVGELVSTYLVDENMAVFDHGQSMGIPCRSVEEGIAYIKKDIAKGKQRDSIERIEAQYAHYRDEGFLDNVGFAWTLVLIRRHLEPDVILQMKGWWTELKTWTRRDQMSFNYVAWRDGFQFVYMNGDPADNKHFLRLWHYRSPRSKFSGYMTFVKIALRKYFKK